MTRLTRTEREDRVAADDGDADAQVLVAETGFNASRGAYHVDPQCRQISTGTEPMSREAAQRQWHVPCKRCVLEADDAGG